MSLSLAGLSKRHLSLTALCLRGCQRPLRISPNTCIAMRAISNLPCSSCQRRCAWKFRLSKDLRHLEDSDWLLRATQHPLIQVGAVERAALDLLQPQRWSTRERGDAVAASPCDGPSTTTISLHGEERFRSMWHGSAFMRAGPGSRWECWCSCCAQRIAMARSMAKAIAYFLAYWFLPVHTLRRLRAAFR